jgi:hypothetical protein
MSVEGYTTLAETTLASGYTAGSGTMSLTSGASFPAAGLTFSVRVNVTGAIYTCTRSSNTLTVTLESGSDVNVSSGASVVAVVTKRAVDNIRSNQYQQGALASLPSTANAGDRYTPTDGYYDYFFNGSVWVPSYRGMICTAPTQTFAFKNQQSSTVSTSKGPTVLTVPAGSINFTLYACPVTPPFTAVALINQISPSRAYTAAGFFAYGSSNDHFSGLAVGMEDHYYMARLSGSNFTNYSLGNPLMHRTMPLWVKLVDDTSTFKIYVSTDGLDWVMIYSETTGTTQTCTHVGIGGGKDTNSPGYDNQVALFSLVIT